MPKRKVISESDKTPTKKLKGQATSPSGKTAATKLSFDSPEQCFLSIIYPKTIEEFFEKNWEKEPLLIKRKNAKYYGDMPTKARLEEIVKTEGLNYDVDVFVSRYSDKEKNNSDDIIEAEGPASVKTLRKYFKDEKATIQLENPMRFHHNLYRSVQLLEAYFGCCVCARLEVTAEGSQGHPPGHMCREEFILQVEGKKHWRLYKPLQELTIIDSEDLDESEIGEVAYEYELEPGDLLYIPRGTISEAVSLTDKHSTHVTIQLYEENYWGNFLTTIIDKALVDALENDISFREGLPLNYQSYMGYGKKEFNDESSETSEKTGEGKAPNGAKTLAPVTPKNVLDKQKLFQEKVSKLLVGLAEHIDHHKAVDHFATSFMKNRLPPFNERDRGQGDIGESAEKQTPPDDESFVQMKYPEHVRIVLYDSEDWEETDNGDEDEEEAEEAEEEREEEEDSEEEENESEKNKKKTKSNTKKDRKAAKEKDESEKQSKKPNLKSKSKAKKEAEKEEAEKEDEEDEKDEGMEEDESHNESIGIPCIAVQHSLYNDAENITFQHKMEAPGPIKFPVHYRDALLILHRSLQPVAVKDLPLDSNERVELVMSLWCDGLLSVQNKQS